MFKRIISPKNYQEIRDNFLAGVSCVFKYMYSGKGKLSNTNEIYFYFVLGYDYLIF
jgi:hypothetical protein